MSQLSNILIEIIHILCGGGGGGGSCGSGDGCGGGGDHSHITIKRGTLHSSQVLTSI